MRITKATVKTFFDIEISTDDFLRAYGHYSEPDAESDRTMYPKAFEGCDLYNHSMGYINDLMRRLGVCAHGDFAAYMARFFGFDGWHNSGFYHTASGNYRMTVFNYGDCIQGGLKHE